MSISEFKIILEKWSKFGDRIPDDMKKKWLSSHEGLYEYLLENDIDKQELDRMFSKEEHMARAKSGQYTDEQVRDLIEHGIIEETDYRAIKIDQIRQAIAAGNYSADEIGNLPYLQPEEKNSAIKQLHLSNIRQRLYEQTQIISLVDSGQLQKDDLYQALPHEEIDELFPRLLKPDISSWNDIPPLPIKRTDIYTLGLAGSGTSMFLASLLHYGNFSGRLLPKVVHSSGIHYLNFLQDTISKQALVESTTSDHLQHLACDLVSTSKKGNKAQVHPITFMDISGELVAGTYKSNAIPDILRAGLKNNNPKIIIIQIDADIEKKGNRSDQRSILEFMLQLLARSGFLAQLSALCVQISKADQLSPLTNEAVVAFLKDRGYLGLRSLCARFAQQYQFDVVFHTFSIGEFYGAKNKKYKYRDSDTKKMFDWICENSIDDTPKQTRRLFG